MARCVGLAGTYIYHVGPEWIRTGGGLAFTLRMVLCMLVAGAVTCFVCVANHRDE